VVARKLAKHSCHSFWQKDVQAKPNEISRNGMNGTVSGMFYALWYLGSWFLFSWLSKITGHTRFIEDFIKNHPSSID
jgi:hypothetical protein